VVSGFPHPGILQFEIPCVEGFVFIELLQVRIGGGAIGKTFGEKPLPGIKIMQDELVIVEQSQFQEIAFGVFEGDGWVGQADPQVISLLIPGEIFDQPDGFFI
jgi:hypothetical protein